MMKLRIWLLALLANLAVSAAAQGAIIKWDLNGTFLQGGFATGSFLFDTNTNVIFNVAITTSSASPSGGLFFDEFRFHTNYFSGPQPYGGEITFGRSSTPTGTQIAFDLPVRLSDLMVASVLQWDVARYAEYTCFSPNLSDPFPYCSQGLNISNWSHTGSLNTLTGTLLPPQVPLPAAFPLFIAGFAALGLVGRKRKNVARC